MARWGKCEYKQLERLQQRMEKLAEADFDAFCRDAAKELAARLLAKVIKATPVGDTVKHTEDVLQDTADTFIGPKAKARYKSGKRAGQVKQRNVIDHMGGTLRRGWTARTAREAESGGSKDPYSYAETLTIVKVGQEYRIEIFNPVPYASYVEYGHRQKPGRYVPALGKRLTKSWAKGKFMLTVSEQELRAKAPTLLDQKLTKFMGECFRAE